MRTNKWIYGVTALVVCWLSISTAAFASIQGDPVSLLTYIADNMIKHKYVVPYADLPEMSKRVLPPKVWNGASASQRAQFQKEFTRLVIRTYASALTSYQDQQVRFFPVRSRGGNSVEVKSEITSSSSPAISVTYRLLKSGGQWKLYDMSVEGVSLISSFRSQFADILSNGSMDTLLKRLSKHNG